MQFGILGPLTIVREGRPVRLETPKLRVLLASLLVRPNKAASFSDLGRRLWVDQPPRNPRHVIHTYVTRLRRTIGDQQIRTCPGGYLIEAGPDQLDLLHFEQLVREADTSTELCQRAKLLHSATDLWRGEPFADIDSPVLHNEDVTPLVERRLLAEERRIDADLELGRHAELVPDLRALVARHPLREKLWTQLAVALFRSGRRADALATYREVDHILATEVGINPGPELRDLHQAMLTNDAL
ncbi:AfsR/SARP family transcriptional regulator [Kribbella sp. CA-294648]|uniref:AfsR/SARP family transcriptional regulator n=1 Tax=Kribbella sp. CA-294648 TaxID=3239948 RepID=UPI003D946696